MNLQDKILNAKQRIEEKEKQRYEEENYCMSFEWDGDATEEYTEESEGCGEGRRIIEYIPGKRPASEGGDYW